MIQKLVCSQYVINVIIATHTLVKNYKYLITMPLTNFGKQADIEDTIGISALLKLIEIDNNQFEYWRKNLDPNKKRGKFFDCDVYFYLIIKEAVLGHFFTVSGLDELDWDFVHDVCASINPDELIELDFVIDVVSENILLLDKDEQRPEPRKRSQLREIPMSEIFEYLEIRRKRKRAPKDYKVVSRKEFLVARQKKKALS